MGTTWGDWIFVTGWCITKVIPALGYAILRGMSPGEIGSAIFTGGSLGIVIWALSADRIRRWVRERRRAKLTHFPAKRLRKIRRLKWLRDRFGSLGIAFITPPILSPMIGVPITIFLKESVPRALVLHIASMGLWAVIFARFGNVVTTWFAG